MAAELLYLLVVVLLAVVFYLIYKNREWKVKFEQRLKDWVSSEEKRIREDAIGRSARTLSGKALEKLIPFLDRFKHDPHDVKWLGDPIELVVFDGYSEGNPNKITFVEIKSGESRISSKQKKIKDLVSKKKVGWEEFRI